MKNCVFCEIDKSKKYNTIIEETDNFLIMPAIGSLVDGYLLIVYKRHLYSISKIPDEIKEEYVGIINKYRKLFKENMENIQLFLNTAHQILLECALVV